MTRRRLPEAVLAVLFLAGAAHAQDRAAGVRTASPKTIDGDASDWADIKAEHSIPGADDDVARFKLAYDDRNLYVLVTVWDESPLRNSAQVIQELLKGGDAVGFCFGQANGRGTGQRILVSKVGGRTVALAMRPGYGEKRPYTYHTAAVGDVRYDFVAPLPEIQVAFGTREDGYTAEVKIPESVTGYGFADGLDFPFDVQVILSNAAGTMNVATAWWHSTGQGPMSVMDIATEAKLYPECWGRAKLHAKDPGPTREQRVRDEDNAFTGPGVPIEFSLPRGAKVSLIILEESGWVVRELVRCRSMRKGRHTVYWDGRDRTGQPMPAGEYRYRIGYFDALKPRFHGSVGNSGRPVYRTEDGNGSIGGTHGGPAAVAAGADGVYMLNSVEEGQKCLRKIDPATGKAKWWATTGIFGAGFAVTEADGFAYMAYGNKDSANIVRFKADTGESRNIGSRNVVPLGKVAPGGLAVVGERIFYSDTPGNRIGSVDLGTGNAGRNIEIPSPRGICRRDTSSLLVCSGEQVLEVDVAPGNAEPFLKNLDAPAAVAVDPQGNVYVAEQGTSQRIRKFSPRGTPLVALGKRGGRGATAPVFDPMAFRDVAGIAFGPDGNLWTVETCSPRRYTKLTPAGRWLEDFYGPTGYATVVVDLDDLSSVYYQANQKGPDYVKARVDYAAYARRPGDPVGSWKVEGLFLMSQNCVDRSARPDFMSAIATESYGKGYVFTGTNRKRYFWKPTNESFALWRWEGGRWVSAAAAGRVRNAPEEGGDQRVIWADTSGDGLVQDDEFVRKEPPTGFFTWIDRDLTVYGGLGHWKPASVDGRGVPRYDGGEFTPFFPAGGRPVEHYVDQENYYYRVSPPAPDGARYYTTNVGAEQARDFWDRASEARFMRMRNGRPQWIIGHHDGRMLRDGDSQMLINVAGEVDGVVIATEVCSEFIAYTSDGLTLGWVSKDAKGRRAEEGPLAWYVENIQPGLFLKDRKTGKRLLFGASTEDVRILEIDGAFGNDITRVDGRLSLPASRPRSEPVPGKLSVPYATWALTNGPRYLGVDGYEWEWAKGNPAATIYSGKALVADVRLRRDAGKLCVFADVLDEPDFPAQVGPDSFGRAIGVELLIGPAHPAGRRAAGEGDTRIFLAARRDGWKLAGAAFICRPASRPVAPDRSMSRMDNRGTFVDPAPGGTLDFSAGLAPIPGADVAVLERFDGHGYRLEAEIPLALLPEIAPPASVTFKRQFKINKTESLPDLKGPVRFNVAAWRSSGGGVKRFAWTEDGGAADAKEMNPSAWGVAETD